MPVVIDASALVELLVQSKRAPAVVQAAASAEMVAPDVINPEVLSALRRLERTGKLRARRASQAVDDLLDAGVRCFPMLPLLPQAWTLRANVSATDACYVALTRDLGCPLVTRGLRLSRAPGLGVPMITV
jgi:predicted nucleic acid-binding protein